MKARYLPLPSPVNLNACNLPTQRDMLKSTKCTVGEERDAVLIYQGGIQSAGTCRGAHGPCEEKMKRIQMRRKGGLKSWRLYDVGFRKRMKLDFYWLWKYLGYKIRVSDSISWSCSQKSLDAPSIKIRGAGKRRGIPEVLKSKPSPNYSTPPVLSLSSRTWRALNHNHVYLCLFWDKTINT